MIYSVAGPLDIRLMACTSYLISPGRLSVFDHLYSSSVDGAQVVALTHKTHNFMAPVVTTAM